MSHRILGLSSWHNAVFLLNSRLIPFTAACRSRHPLFRSYGAILPSSLTRVHSYALVYSTHPPVSVYGTGSLYHNLEVFLGGLIRVTISLAEASPYYQVRQAARICLRSLYLHPLTFYSVRTRTFHYPVTPSKYKQVLEY